jgi:hypothetical protein
VRAEAGARQLRGWRQAVRGEVLVERGTQLRADRLGQALRPDSAVREVELDDAERVVVETHQHLRRGVPAVTHGRLDARKRARELHVQDPLWRRLHEPGS